MLSTLQERRLCFKYIEFGEASTVSMAKNLSDKSTEKPINKWTALKE